MSGTWATVAVDHRAARATVPPPSKQRGTIMHLGQPQRRLLVIDPSVALDPAPDADDVVAKAGGTPVVLGSDAGSAAPHGGPADEHPAGR